MPRQLTPLQIMDKYLKPLMKSTLVQGDFRTAPTLPLIHVWSILKAAGDRIKAVQDEVRDELLERIESQGAAAFYEHLAVGAGQPRVLDADSLNDLQRRSAERGGVWITTEVEGSPRIAHKATAPLGPVQVSVEDPFHATWVVGDYATRYAARTIACGALLSVL